MDRKTRGFSYRCFRIIRKLVEIFYPKITLEGLENLPDGPCLIVGNHAQMNGPIIGELYFPEPRSVWCAGEMMERKAVPAYAYQDFWSGKPRYIRWFFKLLSYLITPLAVCIFNNAATIGVYRDSRVLSTFRQTVRALEDGARVIIFPEQAKPHNHILCDFQEGFVDVARMYHSKTGRVLPFVPAYIAPKLQKVYLGKPTFFDPKAPKGAERRRICDYLMDAVTDMAVRLPEHTVVPYLNVPKKDYPTNIAK